MTRAADTIVARPIAWTPDGGNIDCCYWWFGTQAIYQMGRKYWATWSKHLTLLVKHQREDGGKRHDNRTQDERPVQAERG